MLKIRDKWSFITHFIGIILSVIATIYIIATKKEDNLGVYISYIIFGISMIALYTGSSVYHYSMGSPEHIKTLRKIDHSMIFVLIAGTYTPILYNGLAHPKGIIFLLVIWGLAAAGIVMKMFWLNAPRVLYTLIYIVMGWSIVFDFKAFIALPDIFVTYLLAGGISYTVGAVFYIIKKPNFSNSFGFHEIFHIFILIGTILHFVAVEFYL